MFGRRVASVFEKEHPAREALLSGFGFPLDPSECALSVSLSLFMRIRDQPETKGSHLVVGECFKTKQQQHRRRYDLDISYC